MTFTEAIEFLGIKKYKTRILNSNSTGELNYLFNYIFIAQQFKIIPNFKNIFSDWFDKLVLQSEQNWKRPESVFQHVLKCWNIELTEVK